MKKNIFLVLSMFCMSLLLAGTTAFAHPGETVPDGINAPYGLGSSIVPNGSFDDGVATWAINGRAVEGGGTGTSSILSSGDPSGGGCMVLDVKSDGAISNAFQGGNDSTGAKLLKGETYVFSFWVKTEDVDAYKISSVWLRSTKESTSVGDKRHAITLNCDGEWHYYAVPFVMLEDADTVRLMIQIGGAGKSNFKLYFDEIKLRGIATEPPVQLVELKENKKVRFNDISGHWAEKEITEMAYKGIINGRNTLNFDPEAPVTRAEMVAMIVRAFGFREAKQKNPFLDSNRNDWYTEYLDVAADVGLIDTGMLWRGSFFGDSQLKREELAMFIANSYDKMMVTTTAKFNITHFKDRKEISDWAIIYIMRCMKLNLMEGTAWDYFEPQSTVTRAQAAAAIYRLRTALEEELA